MAIDRYSQWETKCPICGSEELFISRATLVETGKIVFMNSKLLHDGFLIPEYAGVKNYSTEDEVVLCKKCRLRFNLEELYMDDEAVNEYTVVGFYAENDQPFTHHTLAKDPSAAAKKIAQLTKDWSPIIVDVLGGKQKSLLNNSNVFMDYFF